MSVTPSSRAAPRSTSPDGGLKKTIVGTAIGRMLGSALEHAAKKAWAWLEKVWDWFPA
ncbi:hypothetical protein ACGFQG_32225 [Nocardia fluminea]|uniref:hypothetical protein n=1 Tax=Nocardia fluminea TaxID=134984 RepID=UPI00371F8011